MFKKFFKISIDNIIRIKEVKFVLKMVFKICLYLFFRFVLVINNIIGLGVVIMIIIVV